MKTKVIKNILAVSLVIVGCTEMEIETVSTPEKYQIVLSADCATKTYLASESDGVRNVLWKGGDLLGLFMQEDAVAVADAQNVVARLYNASLSSGHGFSNGSFVTELTLNPSKTYTLGIYYPYITAAGSAEEISHKIPALQTQAAEGESRHMGQSGAFAYATASFATPSDMQYYETPVLDFTMQHKTSTMQLALTAATADMAGWRVKSVSVTAPEGCALAGDVTYTPATDVFALVGNLSQKVTLNIPGGAALSTDDAADLFIVTFPTALAGKNLEIAYTLEAPDASAVKTLVHTRTVNSESKALKASTVHKFEESIPSADAEGWKYSDAASFDLSANGTANCYVVSTPGTYSFDATVMGNGQEGILTPVATTFFHTETPTIAPTQASLLWQTTPGLITSVSYADGRITFVKSSEVEYGNALIAAKNASGTILWSWHIWCTELGALHTYISDYGSFETMDRNLGATYASSEMVTDGELLLRTVGMYYQWGRKDPYVGPADLSTTTTDGVTARTSNALAPMYDIDGNTVSRPSRSGAGGLAGKSIAESIKNPLMMIQTGTATNGDWFAVTSSKTGSGPQYRGYSLWGNPEGYDYKNTSKPAAVKTIYDPCPPGYMVPPAEWSLGLRRKSAQKWVGGIYSADNYVTMTFFPYASRIERYGASAWNMITSGDYCGNGNYWYSNYQNANTYKAMSLMLASTSTSFTFSDNQGYALQVRCIQEIH